MLAILNDLSIMASCFVRLDVVINMTVGWVATVNFTSCWLANSFDFGLLGEQSSPKCVIPCNVVGQGNVNILQQLRSDRLSGASSKPNNSRVHSKSSCSTTWRLYGDHRLL